MDAIEWEGYTVWSPGIMHAAFLRAWHLRKLKPLRLITSRGANDIRYSPLGKPTSEMLRVVEPE